MALPDELGHLVKVFKEILYLGLKGNDRPVDSASLHCTTLHPTIWWTRRTILGNIWAELKGVPEGAAKWNS